MCATSQGMEDRVAFDIQAQLINGLSLGVEHISGDPEDDDDAVEYAIVFHLLLLRLMFVKLKPEA